MKNKDSFRVLCAVAVTALAILILFSVFTSIQDLKKEKNEWEVFADKANAYTDYTLENEEFHQGGSTKYIDWTRQSCTINGIQVVTDYRYSYYASSVYTYDSEVLTYGYAFADDDSLRIEWHSKSTYNTVYLSDHSKDIHEVNEDKIVKVQYIPYTSISTMTVNEVIE